ncbi:MAG: hypothetical protein AAGU76_16335 [Sedimentibacter sp.]|uniref:hypothetical protein n=1 Tax=Sedimentibacter sp. TaxID=1960295 RepID=UPI003159422D
MKKTTLVACMAAIAALLSFGCTRLPASEETGLGPAEYEGQISSDELKSQNKSLTEELESTKTELEKLEKDYLNLAKNNEAMISRLREAESRLEIVESEELPEFSLENSDKAGIIRYLNESRGVLEDSFRDIEIIKSTDSRIVFCTKGYGDTYSQIFSWEVGKSQPEQIEGAVFDKDGSWKWLDERFVLIHKGSGNENRVLDAENGAIVGEFAAAKEAYLLPGTAALLIQKIDTGTYSIYDFSSSTEQEIKLDNRSRYSTFEVDAGGRDITFSGAYSDDGGIEYRVSATINIERLKEIYGIKNRDEADEGEETQEMLEPESQQGKTEGNAA